MPLNDPVPSAAADVILYDAHRFDEVVTSNALTYTDRLGNVRLTVAGLEQLVRDLNSPATDFWLEPSATDPTTGYGGVPLQAGMAYLNTSDNVIRYYDGAVWQYVMPPNVILY